jgi:hypothetical protein
MAEIISQGLAKGSQRWALIDTADHSGTETVAAAWARLATGWTSNDENPSAQTTSTQYIHQDTATTDTTSYTTTFAFEFDYIPSNPAQAMVYKIAATHKTLSDAVIPTLQVDSWDNYGTADAPLYYARQMDCAVAVSDMTRTDGKYHITGNLNAQGDPVEGLYAPGADEFGSGGTFTVGLTPPVGG